MNDQCNPTYGKVDDVLEMLTKSKSLHILMVLDRSNGPLRFTQLKEQVSASSTTVSRRIKELEANGLVVRSMNPTMPQSNLYSLSPDGEKLSPVMQSLYDWAEHWTLPS
ncbi:MAG: winged helix-turn-helix transcriptional regulator [Poseidonia sp.]